MDPLTIISILGSLAPQVTKWLNAGKTVQEVADKASDIATIITGKSDINEATEILKTDPTLLVAYQTAMMEQDTTFEQLYISDKSDARKRDIALAATPHGNVRANWLVGIAVVAIFVILYVVIYVPQVSEFAKGVLTTIMGMFIQQLGNIYSFEFGTTRRSREKTDVLNKIGGGE